MPMPRPRPAGTSRASAPRSLAIAVVAVAMAVCFAAVPAAALAAGSHPARPPAADPGPKPTGTASGSPGATVPSPSNPANPFSEAVGGAVLGSAGVVVDPEAPTAPPEVDATAYVVADLDTGEILAAKNAHRRLRPASTLKTLTALTLLPRLDKRARYTAVRADADVEGSRVGLEAGRVYTIDQLFYGLFLPSGNDAANALANASGGMQAAVRLMNDEAEQLGAFDTNAVNTSGLDEPGQYSSAYDLALIAQAGMSRSDFRRYATTLRYDFPGRGGKTFQIQNGNKLLTSYPGTIGVKNGYTSTAHNTLVGAAERSGRRLVVSVLRTDPPSSEKVADLLDWGFSAVGHVAPVGRLVAPADVVRAKAGRAADRSRSSGPGSTSPPATSGVLDGTAEAAGTGGTRLAGETPFPLARAPLWLWAVGVLFVGLASFRVHSYVRTRKRP